MSKTAFLPEHIKKYEEYFRQKANQAFDLTTGARIVSSDQRKRQHWEPPMRAVVKAFDNPWHGSPGWDDLDRAAVLPHIEQWIVDRRIASLCRFSYGYQGWTAECFEARFKDKPITQIVRIGAEGGRMQHLSRSWNPLLLHPYEQTIFICRQDLGDYKVSIERIPILSMIPPGEPQGFDHFVNEHILAGTPYKILSHKDLSVYSCGSPIYGDPDSVGFRSAAVARNHARDQWNPIWQQNIMRIIHENSERIGLPQSMRWVETSPKLRSFRPSNRLPDPISLNSPSRSVIRLKPQTHTGKASPIRPHKTLRPRRLTSNPRRG